MRQALDEITILDFSRVLAGPLATMVLADLGATVIKVERPGTGDDTRAWGPPYDDAGDATYFQAVNRNKRSVALDLGDEQHLAHVRTLAADADVVVENFRPGVMDRLGLGYDELRAGRPELVYCSITGFGAGAGAALPGYDLLVQALGGLMSITGDPDGEPQKVGVALVDVITGLFAAVGILAAVRHRERTGEGQRVDVDLLSCLLAALVNQGAGYTLAGAVPDASATPIRASRPTSCSPPPRGTWSSPSATTSSSSLSAVSSAPRSWRPTTASPAMRRGWRTAPSCAPSWRPRSPTARRVTGFRR